MVRGGWKQGGRWWEWGKEWLEVDNVNQSKMILNSRSSFLSNHVFFQLRRSIDELDKEKQGLNIKQGLIIKLIAEVIASCSGEYTYKVFKWQYLLVGLMVSTNQWRKGKDGWSV